MKKFFKENSLIKWATIMLLVSFLLTWVIKVPIEGGAAFHRAGVLDIFTILSIGLEVFAHFASLLFIVAGFYEVISRTKGYQTIVDSISKKFKKSNVATLTFVLVTMLLFSVFTSVFIEPLVLLLFAPFFITLILKMGKDKITAFFATFGGMLIGTIGSVYSGAVVGALKQALQIEVGDKIIYRVMLLVVVYIVSAGFILFHNLSKKKVKEETSELFEVPAPKKSDKGSVVGVIIILALVALLLIIGFLPWGAEDTFLKGNWAANLYEGFKGVELGGIKIFDSLIGPKLYDFTYEFGKWTMISAQGLLLAASVLIAIVSKMDFDSFFDALLTGFRKIGKTVLVVILAYLVMLFSLQFPVLLRVTGSLLKEFNYFISAVVAFIGSIFGIEFRYALTLTANEMIATHSDSINPSTLAVIFQAVYGLTQFFVPTSLTLLVGLSALDISYSEWLKKTWKYLVVLLGITIIIVLLVTQL